MDKERQKIFFDRLIVLFLGMIIFSIPVSIAMTNLSIALAGTAWLVKKILSKDFKIKKNPLNLLLIGFLFISAVSLISSVDMRASIKGLQRLLKYFLIFYVFIDTVNDFKKMRMILWFALAGLALVSIDGLYQFFAGKDFIRGFPAFMEPESGPIHFSFSRLTASMHNPLDLAVYLMSLIPLALILGLYYPLKKGIKAVIFAVVVIALFCLFNTFYRAVILELAVLLVFFSVLKKDYRPLMILFILLLAGLAFIPAPILQWALDNSNPYDFFIEQGGRRVHWATALSMIKANPFLGVGLNTFSDNYDYYKPVGFSYSKWYAHSSYLQMAAEIGLIGFIFFIFIVTKSMRMALKKIKQCGRTEEKTIILSLFFGFLGYLIGALMESSLQYSNPAILFWTLLAMLSSAGMIIGKRFEAQG